MHTCGYENVTESTFTAKPMLLYISDGDEPSTIQEPGTVGSQGDAAPTFDLSGWHACMQRVGSDGQKSGRHQVGSGCMRRIADSFPDPAEAKLSYETERHACLLKQMPPPPCIMCHSRGAPETDGYEGENAAEQLAGNHANRRRWHCSEINISVIYSGYGSVLLGGGVTHSL